MAARRGTVGSASGARPGAHPAASRRYARKRTCSRSVAWRVARSPLGNRVFFGRDEWGKKPVGAVDQGHSPGAWWMGRGWVPVGLLPKNETLRPNLALVTEAQQPRGPRPRRAAPHRAAVVVCGDGRTARVREAFLWSCVWYLIVASWCVCVFRSICGSFRWRLCCCQKLRGYFDPSPISCLP